MNRSIAADLASIEIEQAYAHYCREQGDIHEHMPVLRWLAAQIAGEEMTDGGPAYWRVGVIEFGVRNVVSTWAFLAARPVRVASYDLTRAPEVAQCEAVCRDAEQNWEFHEVSTLEVDIPPCGLLFIDTLHTYTQLRAELARHADKAKRFLAFHDTASFGEAGEDGQTPGLNGAIDEFLAGQGRDSWSVFLHLANCNGLTILRRR